MFNFTRVIIKSLFVCILVLTGNLIYSQAGVLNPADPIVKYNPAAPPATPAYGQLAKWVKTDRVGFNTTSFKAYYYKGMAFRLKFPKSYQHGVADGKTYPIYVFFHGIGEKGTVYDNEYQLYHGGELHSNAVENGTFDGFLLYPQTSASSGFFGAAQYGFIKEIIENHIVPQAKGDINRIIIEGLSGGGTSTWQFSGAYPSLVAAANPISAASLSFRDWVNALKWTPIWQFQGELDASPHPNTTIQIINAYKNAGGNIRYNVYTGVGHGAWTNAWREADYFPTLNRAHKANPWPLTGRTEFCPGDPINVTVGISAGFSGYEWRRNGSIIAGATGNQITATSVGTYDVRIRRGTTWSVWSPIPVVIKLKAATVPPDITVVGTMSKVLPSVDTVSGVDLMVPAGYASYVWQKEGSTTTLGTSNTFRATTPGNYRVRVTEQYGCSSEFSAPFTVINANGPNKPEPATNLSVATLSKTSLQLNWTDNAGAAFNETSYEIYQANQPGGPYKLVAYAPQNATSYTLNGLNSNSTYYYVLRAINNTAASAKSNEASGLTDKDSQAPTAPGNLVVTNVTKNSVSLSWSASADDVGVTKYEIYVNGVLNYNTTETSFTVSNLTYKQPYSFKIQARDFAGNKSLFSNQVAAQPLTKGLEYKHYTFTGTWNSFPNLNTLSPVATGTTPNVSIAPRVQNDNFAFLWEGFIKIPVSGTYYFRTNSDDGSMLYLGALNGTTSPYTFSGPATVDNNGLHGGQDRTSAPLNLTAGIYPIAITFYEQGGGESMRVTWRTPQTGTSYVDIPDSVFNEQGAIAALIPAAPSNISVTPLSYKSIRVNWSDNSNNETGFEVYRSETNLSGFTVVGTTAANATSFTDTGLVANKKYYYKVKAVNEYGESDFVKPALNVDYAYYQINGMSVLPNFAAYTPTSTGKQAAFTLGAQTRADNFALKLSSYITVPTTGVYTFYTSSDDGSKLYIGSMNESDRVVDNDGLHGTAEKSGTRTLTAGQLYPIYVTFFEQGGGEVLEARYSGPGTPKQLIPASVLGDASVSATTLAQPAAPAAPTGLVASGISTSEIEVTWNDVANNETGYELHRSLTSGGTYTLVASLPANATAYTDTSLSANSIFYYQVRAKGELAFSAYSNKDSALTKNTPPVITAIANQFMRYDGQLQLAVNATDADGGTLTVTTSNVPSFGAYASTGNGQGLLTFAPNASSQGTYTNIIVRVTDQNGGADSTIFTLVVNDNYKPVIQPVSNISVGETQTALVTIVATDQNATALTWSFTGLPAFASTVFNGDSAKITLAPGYTDNGSYTVVAKVDDGTLGVDSVTFTINVSDVNPNKTIYVNFTGGTHKAVAPWNNTNKTPAVNDNFAALKDAEGATTPIGIQLVNAWTGINDQGGNTGNNSGVFPDAVLRSSYYTSVVSTLRVYGLEQGIKYKFTFLGSRANPAAGVGVTSSYTIGSQNVTLDAANNVNNTVTISNVDPQADGTVNITVQKAAGSTFGYLNGLVIEAVYGDDQAPATPRNVTGSLNAGKVQLSWTDAAFNETSYEVFRATNRSGPYQQVFTGAANSTSFADSLISGNKSYYYAVRTVNGIGASAFSDTVVVTTPNVAPLISGVADVVMKTGETVTVNVTATDDPGDAITLIVNGLPSFASFTDNGNGTGVITITPGNIKGVFNNIYVIASDNSGASSNKVISITVADATITRTLVNFNQTFPVGAPWNSFNSAPNAGVSKNNLLDETGVATGINVTLVDKWTAMNTLGVVTGNNSGVYPDDVMRTFYYENSATAKRVRLNGLSANKKYNLVFFASRAGGTSSLVTRYTVGSQSVELDANNNGANTVRINGLSPDGNGEILISMVRVGASPNAYIGAMEIESYETDGTPLAPGALKAAGISRDKISLNWTSSDASVNGYEVWRSSTANGTYVKIADVAGNVTTYTHNGLATPTVNYYKVRSVKDGVFSPYSNYAGASTVTYVVNLNFNDGTAATGPAQGNNWNNTNALISAGFTLPDMINDLGQQTGIDMTMVRNFSGYNSLGSTTGNNSGVVPDNVMKTFFYLNFADTASFKVGGLNLAHVYNFVFFGSRVNPSVGVVTAYKIGNQIVTLNAANNTMNTVQINNIKPDENGEVSITLYGTVQGGFGYINSLTIHGMPAIAADPLIEPTTTLSIAPAALAPQVMAPSVISETALARVEVEQPVNVVGTPVAFPNPFVDDVAVKMSLSKAVAKLSIVVNDINGRVVFRKDFANLPAGNWQQKLGMNGSSLNKGMYIIQVLVPGEKVQTIKLLKK